MIHGPVKALLSSLSEKCRYFSSPLSALISTINSWELTPEMAARDEAITLPVLQLGSHYLKCMREFTINVCFSIYTHLNRSRNYWSAHICFRWIELMLAFYHKEVDWVCSMYGTAESYWYCAFRSVSLRFISTYSYEGLKRSIIFNFENVILFMVIERDSITRIKYNFYLKVTKKIFINLIRAYSASLQINGCKCIHSLCITFSSLSIVLIKHIFIMLHTHFLLS